MRGQKNAPDFSGARAVPRRALRDGARKSTGQNSSTTIDVQGIKAAIDVVAFYSERLPGMTAPKQRPSSSGWVKVNGLCVFHDDRRPGTVSINLVSGAYKCFACDAFHGDVIAFEQAFSAVDFLEAIRLIAGSELPASIRTAPRLAARTALKCLEFEATLVEAAASALANGEELPAEELQRLHVAARRIRSVAEVI